MELKFTRSDVVTFGIGLAAGLAWEVGDALVQSEALFADWRAWSTALGVGLVSATGRWIATYLTLRGFKRP